MGDTQETYKVGDRVRVRRGFAEGFILPLRQWAEDGRMATIIDIAPPHMTWLATYKVRFDTKRPPKRPGDYEFRFSAWHLERPDA